MRKFAATLTLLLAWGSTALAANPAATGADLNLKVFKTPTCGCCGIWVEHLDDQGFATQVEDRNSLSSLKQSLGIPAQAQSCHTGVSEDGYFFEGHVPARYISQFLANPPENAIGLAVPGMPVGSPGMEMGERFDPYQVIILYREEGAPVYGGVYAEVRSKADQ
jgi:hypothetical protein